MPYSHIYVLSPYSILLFAASS